MSISIDLLREFVILAEERHFTKAARRLYISQPSLSKHISQLEESLQVRLLERKTPLELSPAGEVLLEASTAILETYDSAVGTITRLRSRRPLSLCLAGPFCCKHFSNTVMPSVNATRQDHAIEVRIMTDASTSFFELLRTGQVDVVFACASDRLDTEGLVSESVCRSQVCLALRENHRLLKYPSDIPFAELDEEPVLTLAGTYQSWRLRFLDLCDAHRISAKSRVKRSSPFDLHLEGVRNEAVIVCDRAQDYLSFPGFEFRRIQDPDCFYDLRAYWSVDTTNPSVLLFMNHLRERVFMQSEAVT